LAVCIEEREGDRIMKEYLLLIRNEIDHQASWSPLQQHQFLKKCEEYISNLTKEGKLKSAQPLIREGKIISGSTGTWKEGPFNETQEVIVGYYHILADDLDDAIALAKKTRVSIWDDCKN
jgi:hypothetical protein